MRAFLAVELSDEIKECFGRFQSEGERRHHGIRWVRAENVHLTLRFLGETDDRRVEKLRVEVEACLSAMTAFNLTLGGPGQFGPDAGPRTLWFGIEAGQAALAALARGVETAARKVGFPAEKRPWVPHLTVGRNPKKMRVDGWQDAAMASGLVGLSSRVDGITLYSSVLRRGGPVYTAVWKAPLPK